MHIPTLTTFLPFLAFTSALPSALEPRQLLPTGQTVRQDVINIHNAVLALDATVQSFTGSPFSVSLVEGTPVLLGVAEIHKVNRAGYVHALAAVPFSMQDSSDVIDTVVSTVDVSIPASTEHLEAKVAAFKEGGLVPTVIASLELLLYDHDSFSDAVLAKTNAGIGEAKTAEGEAAVKNIHDAIQSAIAFFEAQLV
ncbi:hypothetical protein EK21DRAFT_57026 [Setomelanomma holmii]|uniref:Uncharacterized protein n=1 Tax=Setomelanomma holmii TaxID=210430 RepID=A0A9P4LQF5_9PLEO|nr:hypothetical protein EK21DRAFT_57026 [Setomelanomma holmii]